MEINPNLEQILYSAYEPCKELARNCTSMRWEPAAGFLPRGFLGATGSLEEVELILVCAEPGDPHKNEVHTGMTSVYQYAHYAFETKMDVFHKNIRAIMDSCWLSLSFDEQLKKVWITESVLCSAHRECGTIPHCAEETCGKKFLLPQLGLFPHALTVAMGNKAEERLKKLGFTNFISVDSAAAPGGNTKRAKLSFEKIPSELNKRKLI